MKGSVNNLKDVNTASPHITDECNCGLCYVLLMCFPSVYFITGCEINKCYAQLLPSK